MFNMLFVFVQGLEHLVHCGVQEPFLEPSLVLDLYDGAIQYIITRWSELWSLLFIHSFWGKLVV